MPETPKVNPEPRMLIDGKLVDADSGKTFENINPATEEVLGQTADASPAEMLRAIDAARRAFDETDWSTNRTFRKRCIEQLQEALEAEREHPREELVLERGWYVEPTLFTDVDNAMTFAQEEIFGPVLVVIPFEDDADAVRIASDSPRPGRRVFAGSFERSLAVARSLRTGPLSINGERATG